MNFEYNQMRSVEQLYKDKIQELYDRAFSTYKSFVGMGVRGEDDVNTSLVEQSLHGPPHILPLAPVCPVGVVPRHVH